MTAQTFKGKMLRLVVTVYSEGVGFRQQMAEQSGQ